MADETGQMAWWSVKQVRHLDLRSRYYEVIFWRAVDAGQMLTASVIFELGPDRDITKLPRVGETWRLAATRVEV